MKKRFISIIAMLFALCCLLLSACGNSKSIGVIGGSDGPTSIFISEEGQDTVKKPVRMIKADGKLYYDSGKVSDMTPRCGTMDANLKQAGAEYEIPKNDNECNFEGAEGYQNATSITKELLLDGKWVIFKLFDDAEQEMSVFDYCFYLKGRLPNDKQDTELVVLTEDINYNFSEYSKLTIQSSKDFGENKKDYKTTFRNYGDTDKWGITLSAKNVTNKGLTILFEQFGGTITGELQTGAAFEVEVLKNGNWESVDATKRSTAWNDIAYEIKKNDITELNANWEWLYGELPSGFYRLKKEVTNFRTIGDLDTELYELYFTIE